MKCRYVYKYRSNNYINKEGDIIMSVKYHKMKRLSCREDCLPKEGRCFTPELDAEECGLTEMDIELPKHPKNGKLYEMVFIEPSWTMKEIKVEQNEN